MKLCISIVLLETIYSVPGVKGHDSIVKKKDLYININTPITTLNEHSVRLGGVGDLFDKDVGFNDQGLY